MCEYDRLPPHMWPRYNTYPKAKCRVCDTVQPSQVEAKKCESLPVERQRLNVGKKVIVFEERKDEFNRPYHLVGYIVDVKIVPPDVADIYKRFSHHRYYEEMKNRHNRVYIVNPDRKATDGLPFFATELETTNLRAGLRKGIDLPF